MQTTDNQDEMFIVVDRNDRIIGYKSRFECHHNPMFLHRTIGVLIHNSKGELLLQKRSKTKDLNPGHWSIGVGGHVTRGQTYDEAVKREMDEELGISVPVEPIKKWILKTKEESEMSMLYTSVYDGPFKIDTTEVEEIKFYTHHELKKLYKNNQMKLSPCTILTLKEVNIL